MCWTIEASLAVTAAGAAATAVTFRRGETAAIWGTLGYFTLMEALQALSYPVADQCGLPANKALAVLSYLHIAFQPLVINAFCLAIVPAVAPRTRGLVMALAGLATALLLFRLVPVSALGPCPDADALCGPGFCVRSGDWHIAWDFALNDLWGPLSSVTGFGFEFPGYLAAVFLLPLFYGAWRFVLFHALAGPALAMALTPNPDEWPAVWCLFSIGILAMGLSPWIRARVFPAAAPA